MGGGKEEIDGNRASQGALRRVGVIHPVSIETYLNIYSKKVFEWNAEETYR